MMRSLVALFGVLLLATYLPCCSSGSNDTDGGIDANTDDADGGGADDGSTGDGDPGMPGDGDAAGDPGTPDAGDQGGDEPLTHELTVWLFSTNNPGDVEFLPDTYPTFAAGSEVTLTPVPGAGNTFPFWLGFDRADVVDNGDGTYGITMNEDKDLMAVFAEEASLGVEVVGPVDKRGNILYEFETLQSNEYVINYADDVANAYVNCVYDEDGEFYGTDLNDFFIDEAGSKVLVARGDAIYIEVGDWGNEDSEGGSFSLLVTGEIDGPEIDLRDPDDASLASGGFCSLDIDKDGGPVQLVFSINNNGNAPLHLLGEAPDYVSLTTTDPVTISDQPDGAAIAAGGQDSFTLTVTPDGNEAIYEASISVENDDPDGGEAPFTFDLEINAIQPQTIIFEEDFEGDGTLGGLDSGNTWEMSSDNAVDPLLVDEEGAYDKVQQGTYSARLGTPESTTADREPRTENDPPGSNEHSGMLVNLAVPNASTLKFWYWVETEDNYDTIWDYLGVFIDGTIEEENKFALTTSDPDHKWRQATVAIPAGTTSIEFKYVKDVNMTEYEDCAWIDSLVISED